MKQFLKNNLPFAMHFLLSLILEISTLFVLTSSIMIKEPWILLSITLALFFIYNLITNIKAKNILISVVFSIQLIINLFCVILYENTGTLFDFSMIYLATESTDFLSTITINYGYIAYIIILLTIYLLSNYSLSKYQNSSNKLNYQSLICSILLSCTILGQGAIFYFTDKITQKNFIHTLYKDTNEKYINYGGSGNFINEITKLLFFNKYNELSSSQIESFIYENTNKPTNEFAKSKGNNLVTILVESFEWFGFVTDTNAYPNGANLTQEQLEQLFPNLRSFYNNSLVMNNHYSQNKTDISEFESLSGFYPSSAYVSYQFPNNTILTSTTNMLKQQDASIATNFFHANTKTYYNREKVNKSLGFDNAYFVEDMEKKGYTNYIKLYGLGEGGSLNLDSEMFSLMKDEMFPTDKRFYSHITTISMHGHYIDRPNMKKRIDKMSALGIEIKNNYLKNYIAAIMDFDEAIGIMMDDLKNKGLLDNTTICMYSDHNTYMSNLTYQIKGHESDDYKDTNYIELYRVPFMIYDKNFNHEVINKFTTTNDIVPTILDLFGINYYSNLYYGHSIFDNEESILYSKAFDVFIADGLFYSNINNILYKRKDITKEDINIAETKSLELLKKIYYTNHIFEYNYFKNKENYNKYINNIKSINEIHN